MPLEPRRAAPPTPRERRRRSPAGGRTSRCPSHTTEHCFPASFGMGNGRNEALFHVLQLQRCRLASPSTLPLCSHRHRCYGHAGKLVWSEPELSQPLSVSLHLSPCSGQQDDVQTRTPAGKPQAAVCPTSTVCTIRITGVGG